MLPGNHKALAKSAIENSFRGIKLALLAALPTRAVSKIS
jgi:hypothetical protein